VKFEKINMKLVAIIGVIIILFLTILFIIFRTNLIINNGKKDDSEKTNSTSTSNSSSRSNTNTNTDSNTNTTNSNNSNNKIVSEEAKSRTKSESKLTLAEKEYIFEDNARKNLTGTVAETCKKPENNCSWEVGAISRYSQDYDIGFFITGCTGTVSTKYDEAKKDFVFDMSKVVCK
jgi:cell division protein FtsI/penicillin-binding protein 2